MHAKQKVVAALAAAINLYIQAEQQQPVPMELPGVAEVPRPAYSPWAMSGRQTAMDTRRMWQMRLVR